MTQSRRLLWEGCLNVRDLGGHTAANGSVTRAGSLIRSDNLARLTAAGQRTLRETGVSIIIDVRSPYELALKANPFAQIAAVNPPYLNLPLLNEADAEAITLVNEASTLIEMYRIMLERFRANIGEIIAAVVTAPPGAVVFHCHSGKDRTGLITALVLKLVDVPEAAIAEDYALSDAYLSTLYSEMLDKKADPEERARLAEQLTSKPDVILSALSHLEEQYGGIEPYLETCGLNQQIQQRLCERLLEPEQETTF